MFALIKLGEGGESWKWRRRWLACEEELVGEYRILLLTVTLQVDIQHRWLLLLTSEVPYHLTVVSDLIWRLFQNKLSTKDNFFGRDIIPRDSQLCVSGCGNLESASCFFQKCNYFWFFVTSSAKLARLFFGWSNSYFWSTLTIWQLSWCLKIKAFLYASDMVYLYLGYMEENERQDF